MKKFNVINKFLRPDDDFPEGEQFIARLTKVDVTNVNPGEEYGTEIEENGVIRKVKFNFVFDVDGLERVLTQSSAGLYRQIVEKGIDEGDTVAIVRIGKAKERRMTIIKK